MTLNTYNDNPTDANAALLASNEAADQNLHDLAMLLAEHGLHLQPSLETETKLLERMSISGFYSKTSQRKELGKIACEKIATNRSLPWHTKNLARQNSTYYAKSAADLMPSLKLKKFDFIPNDNYRPMNPSIVNNNDELWMIQRTVNYIIRPDGSYDMGNDHAIRTRNYLIRLNDNLEILHSEEIYPPLDLPNPEYNLVIGWEDCRLFFWNNEPFCTATVRELNKEGYCEIVLSAITRESDNKLHFSDYKVINPTFTGKQHEKNWMPLISGQEIYFVYSSDPARVVDVNGNLVSSRPTHIAADSYRGGGPLLQFEDGWLAVVHESHVMPDNQRKYMHRFVWYDQNANLLKHSEAFYIHTLGIEFVAGLARNSSTNEIVLSFGLRDKESWFATVSADDIKKILKPAGLPAAHFPSDSYTINWIKSQTNTVLKSSTVVDRCKSIITRSNLILHQDSPKNWDNLIALYNVVSTTDSSLPIMDIAATKESAFLPSLQKLGYDKLISINIDQPIEENINGISYLKGDCTKTEFPDSCFGFIACLSVIEHGVDIDKFFAETARLLASGGHVFVSTDYWETPVDTLGQTAFGAPVKVFTADDIQELIKSAEKCGFRLTSPLPSNLSCEEKVVNWIGMDYTFINLLFQKI